MRNITLLVQSGILLALVMCVVSSCASNVAEITTPAPRAEVSTIGFVTRDLYATIEFYTNVLGYTVVGTADVTADKARQVIGASIESEVKYTALAPQAWIDGDKSIAIISFFEVSTAPDGDLAQDAKRMSVGGEAILAHRVDDIDMVARRAQESGVLILAPLGDSGTSRTSRSIALLDPNGIRIEVYDY